VVSREGLRVREVSTEEGNRLLKVVRRSSGSVVTWRRAQMVLLSVQGMDVAGIAKVTFTSPDRVREVINNFNEDGFDSLYPKYAGQEDRPVPPRRSQPAVLDVELDQVGRVPRRGGGGRRHQP
jgi:hypothetical protein